MFFTLEELYHLLYPQKNFKLDGNFARIAGYGSTLLLKTSTRKIHHIYCQNLILKRKNLILILAEFGGGTYPRFVINLNDSTNNR